MYKHALLLAFAGSFLAACSSSDSPLNATTQQDITLSFAAEANNIAIDCDTQLTGLGTQNTNAELRDFRFYLHNIEIVDNEGATHALNLNENNWQTQNVALIDFTNRDTSCGGDIKDTRTIVEGSVPLPNGRRIADLNFTIGLPSTLNHNDRATAPAPLDLAGLHWNWQNGYKFMRLDVAPEGGITRSSDPAFSSSTWNFHLGSTGCTGDPQLGETVTCTRPDRPVISLSGFDPESSEILIDYEALVTNNNLQLDEGDASGCMSGATDPECAALFNTLGMDLNSGASDAAFTQTVFSLR